MAAPDVRTLELKIPPVPVALIVAGLMWLAAREWPAAGFRLPAQREVAAALVLAGLGMAVLGVVSFRRARTTVHPMKPGAASTLVTSGIYRYTRNPMYLGLFFCLAGWALVLGNGTAWLGLPVLVSYLHRFQIVPEERALAGLFGAEFAAYQTRVRRWL